VPSKNVHRGGHHLRLNPVDDELIVHKLRERIHIPGRIFARDRDHIAE
jgi:hypothetical protein